MKNIEEKAIRKALIHFIKEQDGCLTAIDGISVKDILSWLEKKPIQNESKESNDDERIVKKTEDKFECPNINVEDAIEVSSRMKYIDDDLKPIANFIIDYASWNLHKDEWNQPTLEVPLFRVWDALMLRGKAYCGG